MNKVSKKIILESENKAKEIAQKALGYLNELKADLAKEIAEHKETLEQECTEEYNSDMKRAQSRAQLLKNREILSAKMADIEKLKGVFKEKLCADEKRYVEFLKNTLVHGVLTGNEEILCSIDDVKLVTDDLIKDANKAINDLGVVKGNLKRSSDTIPDERGIILREGKYLCRATVDAVVDGLFERNDIEITTLLFGE